MAHKKIVSSGKSKRIRKDIIWSLGLIFFFCISIILLIWAYNTDSDSVRALFGYDSLQEPTVLPTHVPTISPTPTITPTPVPVKAVIVIDPGHGGSDKGCTDQDGTLEKDLTLTIALALQERLEKMEYAVYLTREDDHYVSQSERVKVAEDNNADLLLSLHINSYTDSTVHGMEVYYGENEDASLLSKLILKDLINETGSADRGAKQDTDLWLLANSSAPSCSIMLGFISNPDDKANLLNFVFRTEIVIGIADGIDEYVGRE